MTLQAFFRFIIIVALIFITLVAVDYRTIPSSKTSQAHFDTIIVLGAPSTDAGEPSSEQRQRVEEGVREVQAGIAPRLIVTGGAAHNRFVEAESMSRLAYELGLAPDVVFEEPQAQNTIQNVFYSARIMHAHAWHSAEVVSSPSHLPRAALILLAFNRVHPDIALAWRTHAARWPPAYGFFRKTILYAAEASYCLRLRVFGFPAQAAPFLTHP